MRRWFDDRHDNEVSITREAAVQTPLRLEMRTHNGRVEITGVPGETATVRARIEIDSRYEADGLAERVAAGIAFAGATLSIDSPELNRRCRVYYEVSVPLATQAQVIVANGPVGVRGIEGPVKVTVANGPLDVERVGGLVEVQLANGPVMIRECKGQVEAQIANGPLHVDRTAGPLDLRVSNGPVRLEEVGAGIEASVTNGHIAYRGTIGGDFDLRSHRGEIVLELPRDSRFELDAEAERGEVYSDFVVNQGVSSASTSAPVPRLFLRSDRGRIRLQHA
jgi:hypothetical protein